MHITNTFDIWKTPQKECQQGSRSHKIRDMWLDNDCMNLLLTPRNELEYHWRAYLEFKLTNVYSYPKKVIHIHTSDISKLDRVKHKSHHGCEIGGYRFRTYFFYPQCHRKALELGWYPHPGT